MAIKVGDKVKIINKYSSHPGKVGIVVSVDEGSIKVFTAITDYSFRENDLELLEVAHYVPVSKFHIGDIVYDKDGKKYLILEEREDNLVYHCWAYTTNANVFRFEDELTKDKTQDENERD